MGYEDKLKKFAQDLIKGNLHERKTMRRLRGFMDLFLFFGGYLGDFLTDFLIIYCYKS